jgi:hypothetical protein
MTVQVGFDPSQTYTSAENLTSGRGWARGSRVTDYRNQEWIYVQAGTAIPQNNVVRVHASATAAPWTSAGMLGTAGGIRCNAISASASIAADSYGWVMTRGEAAVKIIGSATGTIVPTALLYCAASANPGQVTVTASTVNFAAIGLSIKATATTSTTASALPVVFWNGFQMSTSLE